MSENIDRSWLHCQYGMQYLRGIEDFIRQASNYVDKKCRTKCPCQKCKNMEYRHIDVVKQHLFEFGMLKDYTRWVYHGEPEVLSEDEDDDDDGDFNNGSQQGLEEFLEDLRSARESMEIQAQQDEYGDTHVSNLIENQSFPNTREGSDKAFNKILSEARQPLYPGCKKFTKLDFLVKLLHLKIINRWSNKSFDGNLGLIKAALPEGETLPSSYSEAKTLIRNLGLGYIPIHACKYDCALFWKKYETLQNCPECGEPRYKTVTSKGKKIPQKVLRYFPLKARLQRLYMSRMTAADMRWHKEKRVREENVYKHPADSLIWEEFDQEYEWFANDPRNVRLGIASDGFNPFGNMSNAYSMWPVMVVPYNMPPWKCMKDPFIFMSLLIPGPTAPGNDIDVYLQPLIDELNELWEDGVETYDALARETFRLHAAVLWTINDFPAYANLSGWSTKGKMACPVCNEHTASMYLKHSRKLCYMNHIRFLPPKHPLRKRARQLFGHLNWSKVRPENLSGDHLLSQLEYLEQQKFGKNPNSKKRKRSEIELNWTKKSIFFELPYWRKLELRHNLDVMHIEKNICESVLGTILKMDGKTKDTIKSRLDLEVLGIRSELHLAPALEDRFSIPHACYVLSPTERKSFCEWLKIVKFPDGYASNISRCVSVKESQVSGLKSHDCHVLLQRLLPVALRGFLADEVSYAIIELGFFFKELCCKTLKLETLEKMEKDIVVILCKLEQVFPPSFFDVMVHLAVHLPREAMLAGPVQYRWMYPIERYLRTLKQYVRNKAHPEGSIAEAYIDSECLTFCSMYLQGIETRFNREERNFDGNTGEQYVGLDVFMPNIRPLSAPIYEEMSFKDFKKAEFYVLNNSEEVLPFLDQHKEVLKGQGVRECDLDKIQEQTFAQWFLKHMQGLQSADSSLTMRELYALACGPDRRVNRYSGCIVNGIRFHTKEREMHLRTQNCGVVVKGEHHLQEVDFYGVLKDIIALEYIDNKRVFLFKCDWWDVRNKTGIRRDQYFTSVNVSKKWYEDDQFVLATQASQCFYLSDTKWRGTWQVVQGVEPRNVFNVAERENEVDVPLEDETYQCEEQIVMNEIQDEEIRLDKLNRVDVAPDDVLANTVMKMRNTNVAHNIIIIDEEVEEEDDTLMEYCSEEEDTASNDDESDLE